MLPFLIIACLPICYHVCSGDHGGFHEWHPTKGPIHAATLVSMVYLLRCAWGILKFVFGSEKLCLRWSGRHSQNVYPSLIAQPSFPKGFSESVCTVKFYFPYFPMGSQWCRSGVVRYCLNSPSPSSRPVVLPHTIPLLMQKALYSLPTCSHCNPVWSYRDLQLSIHVL